MRYCNSRGKGIIEKEEGSKSESNWHRQDKGSRGFGTDFIVA
jgi:hypothetical protein